MPKRDIIALMDAIMGNILTIIELLGAILGAVFTSLIYNTISPLTSKYIIIVPITKGEEIMKVCLVLAGCGAKDGSEIHESTLTLLSLVRAGFEVKMFAPNDMQTQTANHLTEEVADEQRNMLVESARIARGAIEDLHKAHANDFDVLCIPGGTGAGAKNFSSFAKDGSNLTIRDDIRNLICNFHARSKWIVAICISPVLVAKSLVDKNISLTIGNNTDVAGVIEKLGHSHHDTNATGITVDNKNKVISTPAYMIAKDITQVAEGIDNAIIKLKELLDT